MFKTKTVDALLKQFTTLRDELLGVADKADGEAINLTNQIEALRQVRGGAKMEAKRAREAAARIDAMFRV